MEATKIIRSVLYSLPEPKSEFTTSAGFRYGMSDNPPLLNQKPIPIGAAGCLLGITFVPTGTMPCLTRSMLKELIERYGGRVTSAISGRTDILIRGITEVGPSKIKKAKEKGIKILDEDLLFQYLASTNPNYKPPKPKGIEGKAVLPDDYFPPSTLLSEKYRPRKLSDILGNRAAIESLMNFFKHFGESDEKCAILSGPPGVGKTTTAHIVALEFGYNSVEFNASDTRSRKLLQETISDAFRNTSLKSNTKLCLIFDEIDGMSRSDIGGLQELAKLVQTTSNPVICICNERGDKKYQTLAKYSVDIQFKPTLPEVISSRLREISDKENINVSDSVLDHIARTCNGDFRCAINNLQFWVKSDIDDDMDKNAEDNKKNVFITEPLDAAQQMFLTKTTMDQRFEDYFVDYSLVPLYIQENIKPGEDRHNFVEALDSISYSDLIDSAIFDTGSWNLLNTHALLSSVMPTTLCSTGDFTGLMKYPSYFGKYGKRKKLQRYTQEIGNRSSKTIGVSSNELYDSVIPCLTLKFMKLLQGRSPQIEQFLGILNELQLTKDDFLHVLELSSFGEKDFLKKISSNVKTQITNDYKKKHNDDQTKIRSESEVRADYLISSAEVEKRGRTKRRAKAKKDDYSDEDLDDYTDEEYDEEYEEKSNKKKKNNKRGKDWRRKEEDDESFVVDDDVIEYEEPKKRGRKKGSKNATTTKKGKNSKK
ncbi:replication factor C subunit 1 [Histomonas meleagridis]|uniref:replication factor C subunit 1 n=1 Tax=Histomonas meleagridis TaxID=135588 RepID=UPI00355A33A2|nr:replication factor C subunit 1 [Histomonas meleagridis]KAH0803892.1 replication factor C subunit 1 [Histomonas meleagridis]